jgi:ABC-type glycerol-3-phosphate transport system permease component
MQKSEGGVVQGNPIGSMLASGVVLFIPMLFLFTIFQKYLIGDRISGGLKE